MHNPNWFFLFALVGLFILAGCKKDPTDEGPSIIGRWEIEEAKRNGRSTESLRNLHFTFLDSGQLLTNLSGQEETGSYIMGEGTIETNGVQLSLEYELVTLTDSLLNLKSSYGNYRFDFRLRRVPDELSDVGNHTN